MGNSKIYTKTGDKGETSLIGGKRVPKNHIRIEACGAADELNSFVGALRDQLTDNHSRNILLLIQQRIFVAEAMLAKDESASNINLPCLKEEDILIIEKEIDKMNEDLPSLSSFILPGGHPAVSGAHVARCVCRRAERVIIHLEEQYPGQDIIIRYFNRLSDYFFVLARKLARDFGADEILWKDEKCQ